MPSFSTNTLHQSLTRVNLGSPSTSLVDLTARQDVVGIFYNLPWLRQDVNQYLKRSGDAAKILQRFSLGRGDVDDLLQIKQTISAWHTIKQRVLSERARALSENGSVSVRSWACLDIMLAKMADLADISKRIELAVESSQASDLVSPEDNEEDLDVGGDMMSTGASLSTPDTRWKLASLLAGGDITWRVKPRYSICGIYRKSSLTSNAGSLVN